MRKIQVSDGDILLTTMGKDVIIESNRNRNFESGVFDRKSLFNAINKMKKLL